MVFYKYQLLRELATDNKKTFSNIISEISIAVLEGPIEEINRLIYVGFEKLALLLNASAMYLYYFNGNNISNNSKIIWPKEKNREEVRVLKKEIISELLDSILSGSSIYYNSLRSEKDDIYSEIATWKGNENFDVACIPVRSRGRITGFIGIDRQVNASPLNEDEEYFIRSFCELITAAHNRANKDETIKILMREFSVMQEFSEIANRTISKSELISGAVKIIERILKPDCFGIGLINPNAQSFELKTWFWKDDLGIEIIKFNDATGIVYQTLASKKIIRIDDVSKAKNFVSICDGMNSELCVPILYQDKVIGVINVESKKYGAYSSLDERLLLLFSSNLAIAISKIDLFKEITQMAVSDPLTNIANRRKFINFSEFEFAAAKRYNRKLSIIMLDIDNFKKINDQYGHGVGDAVLISLANTISESLRETDLVARLGGDEFVIILPETRIGEAIILSNRIEKLISNIFVEFTGGVVDYRVSQGIAEISDDINSISLLLERADSALLLSKSKEQKGISLWSEVETPF